VVEKPKQEPARVIVGEPIWKKHSGKIIIFLAAFAVFSYWNTDAETKGRLLLFLFGGITLWVASEIIRFALLPQKMYAIGEKHVVEAAHKYFNFPVTMSDCTDMIPFTSREWLYEFHCPGDGRIVVFGYDIRGQMGVRKVSDKPITHIVADYERSKLISGLAQRQNITGSILDDLDRRGISVPGMDEDGE